MEKALHDYFCINTGRELKFYSKKEFSTLIEIANSHVERKSFSHPTNTIPVLDAFMYDCMDEYYKNGFTDQLMNQLNDILKNLKIQCLFEKIDNSLQSVHVAYIPFNSDPIILGAYMFSQVSLLSRFEGLKRCESRTCSKFFIGRSNAKWCSNSCGSKHRVTKMRKNKKNCDFYL